MRLLIVDDHAPFRAVVRRLLGAAGFEVVGEVPDGDGVPGAVAALRPEVVILDVQLPDTDGFAVAETLATMAPRPAVVLVSNRAEADYGGLVGRSRDRQVIAGFIAKPDLSPANLREVLAGQPRG
jgi:DNA-binding NarL/FixJ family response regulator